MTATTVNQKYVADNALYRQCKEKANVLRRAGDKPDGLVFFANVTSETIATTSLDEADDEVFSFTMPFGAKLLTLKADFGDLDSGSDLVVDVIAENSAGTETVLINDSVAGKTGAVDELDAGLAPVDVSGMKIGIKVVTPAATAVAGTIDYVVSFFIGDYITL